MKSANNRLLLYIPCVDRTQSVGRRTAWGVHLITSMDLAFVRGVMELHPIGIADAEATMLMYQADCDAATIRRTAASLAEHLRKPDALYVELN